jgi:hypothetical protein
MTFYTKDIKMTCHKIALFGEAEKGEFCFPLAFSHLPILADTLGNPPDGSHGLHLAVQTLIFEKDIFYVRVKEEGFSVRDYERGLYLLKQNHPSHPLSAICMPGMGDTQIVHQALDLCRLHSAILITTERDFYDYMTGFNAS